MRVRLLTSPYAAPAASLGQRLSKHLSDPELTELVVVVAWARRSGLLRIAEELRKFRARRGTVRVILGIDEGGATREGLELARELADESFVFHDPHGGTFHPKLYLLKGDSRGVVIVGSPNLTRGGLFTNYEAAVELELDLPADTGVLNEVEHWIEQLRSEDELCLELNDALLGRILEQGSARSEDDREDRVTDDRAVRPIVLPFGRSRNRKASTPRLPAAAAPATRPRAEPAAKEPAPSAAQQPARIVARWFKRLDSSGAQQPPSRGTNVTGVVRLTQAGFPIDWRTWFRREFFGGARWRRTTVSGQPADEVDIPFDVTIDRRYLGTRRLTVSHAPHREAGQANVPTVLRWGDLMPELKARDFTHYWFVLARTEDGRYQLSIQRGQPSA